MCVCVCYSLILKRFYLSYCATTRHLGQGHSESKGAKKREKSASGNGNKQSRGVATSFGFRRRPASTSRADDNARRKQKPHDKNGNGGSTEDLRAEEVLSGRSTPLARPRKETPGQPLRTNRQPHSKTAKVADVSVAAEHAFTAPPGKDKETAINNNAIDKKSTNQYNLPLLTTQVSSTGVTTIVGATGVPKSVTKQTVILTYQPQKYQQDGKKPSRAEQPIRAASVPRTPSIDPLKPPGKYTFQTNQLPRPQYPSVKNIDSKTAKQVVNNTRKAGAVDGWREGAGSAVSTDSGVWTGGEGELSPRSRRRPRNLEMVMRGTHNFHLRELQVADLDIMDEAVVTGHAVIPLPKLPSSFNEESSPECEPEPIFSPPSPVLPKPIEYPPVETPRQSSPMSTLDRYRTRTRPSRIQTNEYKDEEKFVLDRAQPEVLDKQKSFIKSSSGVASPAVDSSKESSPSCKSEASHFGNSSAWQSHAAGEAMANRSQDDVSLALSVSSCEDDKSKLEAKESEVKMPEVPTKTIVITDEPPVPHPLLMKSLTLSQHDSLRGTMMGSMTSSNYSTTSTCTNQSADHNLTLTLEESKFDMSALETSTQSLLDDETSPADSLISSTSTSDSNNDLHVDRDAPSISSAYQTANTKTRTPEPIAEEDDRVDGEILQPVNEVSDGSGSGGSNSKELTPPSPGTPTHASGSLSLSDGRDFFDDEIADQPALLFRKNNHGSPSLKRTDSDSSKQLRRSREHIMSSPQTQRSRKCGGRNPAAERTPSLDTLSSLASDDLMMDNDLAQSVTSLQSVDDYIERLDSSLRSGLNSLDERQLRQELSSSKTAVRQWSQLLEKNNLLDRQLAAMAQGKVAPDSLTGSTSSLTNIGATLPVRTARLLQRSRTQTPSDAGISDGSTSPAPAPSSLLQDVVDIKTLLLQLKRVLQEPGEEHHSMSSETLDPLLAACAESPARGNGRRPPASPLHPDACAEMRRQIVYLQGQLEERDRLVRVLQQQMLRMAESHEPRADDTCNVATQTDRLRPPIGTTLTSSENSGLVSWNEQASGRKLPYSDAQKTKRPVTNGTVKCQCGAKVNGLIDNRQTDKRTDSVQLKSNSRVGSKYLQALASNTENRRYIKRDSSVGEKSERRNLYSARSRSIENFHNQHYLSTEPLLSKAAVIEESSIKHHTSYGDLYNGRISSKESVNGNRYSPNLNGQSTDTDYSSDGGYKSLPSSINYNISPKKVSYLRYFYAKLSHVKCLTDASLLNLEQASSDNDKQGKFAWRHRVLNGLPVLLFGSEGKIVYNIKMQRTKPSLFTRLREELFTYCAFCVAVSALPALTLSFIVVRISKHFWLKLLSSKYPMFEFIGTDTIRTLLDTHRNQGIINVLLCIKGTLNAEEITNVLNDHVIERRDENGDLMFPRLRHHLVSSWGNYAWDATHPFRIENHVFVAKGVHRGRHVSDLNIQDYVSEIISKYFPPEQPPWQYVIIPCKSNEPKYYILVRVHHLLLTGKKSLNIGDFLLIEQLPPNRVVQQREYYQQSALSKLFPVPSHIPQLWGKINESLSNIWNEFICEYDPATSPELVNGMPGVFHVAGMVMVSAANALREVTKHRFVNGEQHSARTTTFFTAIKRECTKRYLTVPKIIVSPLITFDPRKLPRKIIGATYQTTVMMFKLPSIVRDEVIAFNELLTTGRVRQTHTYTWKYSDIGQLCMKATNEALKVLIEIYRAPSCFWNDIIRADNGKRHMLQTVSLCGRKVTAWSRPVSRAGMERAARALGVSSSDVALYAATEALRAFFEGAESDTPDSVLITARAASEDFLYTFAEGNGKNYKKSQTGGMICLALPVGASPRRISAVVYEACTRQNTLAAAWAAQTRSGALTKSIPAPLAKITMNILSRKYAVSYAEINSPVNTTQRSTLWGKTVDHIIYWRPPQANISMSLTLIQYADTVRLSIMADARLRPSHTVPATRWPAAVETLVEKIDQEIARITAQAQMPFNDVPHSTASSNQEHESSQKTQETRGDQGNSQGYQETIQDVQETPQEVEETTQEIQETPQKSQETSQAIQSTNEEGQQTTQQHLQKQNNQEQKEINQEVQ
ncbi:unnamed protein product, partial [Brenthis ino]